VPPKVPTLFTTINAPPQYANNSLIYGASTNPFVLNGPSGVIEILAFNMDVHAHPFHLHGHIPQIIQRSPMITSISGTDYLTTAPLVPFPASPMRRDTG
jgi:iron transport multicopper oxidase